MSNLVKFDSGRYKHGTKHRLKCTMCLSKQYIHIERLVIQLLLSQQYFSANLQSINLKIEEILCQLGEESKEFKFVLFYHMEEYLVTCWLFFQVTWMTIAHNRITMWWCNLRSALLLYAALSFRRYPFHWNNLTVCQNKRKGIESLKLFKHGMIFFFFSSLVTSHFILKLIL